MEHSLPTVLTSTVSQDNQIETSIWQSPDTTESQSTRMFESSGKSLMGQQYPAPSIEDYSLKHARNKEM